MPRPRWQKLSSSRRAQVVDAVLDELAEVGLARASVNRVLRAAKLSKGSLYYYFDDREDLLGTVLEQVSAGVSPALVGEVLLSKDPATFWAEIEGRYAQGLHWLAAHPRLRRILSWAVEHTGPDSDLARVPRERVGAVVEQLVQHGQHVGAVRTDLPDALLLHMLLSLLYALDTWSLQHPEISSEVRAEQVVDAVRRLVEPHSSSSSCAI